MSNMLFPDVFLISITLIIPSEIFSQSLETPSEALPNSTGKQENKDNVVFINIESDDGYYKNMKIIPSEIKIKKGTTVIWTNNDSSIHTITSGEMGTNEGKLFDSDYLGQGEMFYHTFNASGIYNYFDRMSENLKGLIVVF